MVERNPWSHCRDSTSITTRSVSGPNPRSCFPASTACEVFVPSGGNGPMQISLRCGNMAAGSRRRWDTYEVYLLHFPAERCFKVGLTKAGTSRVANFVAQGGRLIQRISVENGPIAEIVEADVLGLTEDWHRLGDPYRSGGGYTEMWSDLGPTVESVGRRLAGRRPRRQGKGNAGWVRISIDELLSPRADSAALCGTSTHREGAPPTLLDHPHTRPQELLREDIAEPKMAARPTRA